MCTTEPSTRAPQSKRAGIILALKGCLGTKLERAPPNSIEPICVQIATKLKAMAKTRHVAKIQWLALALAMRMAISLKKEPNGGEPVTESVARASNPPQTGADLRTPCRLCNRFVP